MDRRISGRARLLPVVALAATIPTWGCASAGRPADASLLQRQVIQVERAFARTMADRDLTAFASYLSAEAVFFSRDEVLRGRGAVAAAWARFFDGPEAPFSWEPDRVEVLESGKLALSTGPVRDPAGVIVGRFTSIWRLEAPGRWRIVFDSGSPACEDPPAP